MKTPKSQVPPARCDESGRLALPDPAAADL